jgi:hypothetical protein
MACGPKKEDEMGGGGESGSPWRGRHHHHHHHPYLVIHVGVHLGVQLLGGLGRATALSALSTSTSSSIPLVGGGAGRGPTASALAVTTTGPLLLLLLGLPSGLAGLLGHGHGGREAEHGGGGVDDELDFHGPVVKGAAVVLLQGLVGIPRARKGDGGHALRSPLLVKAEGGKLDGPCGWVGGWG